VNDFIFDLHSDLSALSPVIGLKIAALNQLARASFHVPPGLCIGLDAFHEVIALHRDSIHGICLGLNLRELAQAQAAANDIAALLETMPMLPVLATQLASKLPALSKGPFVVRSSATLEDLPHASFAGQYRSVLGAYDVNEVLNAIKTCWRSFFSAQALVAQAASGVTLDLTQHGMAVLIQPLVSAECAGVCFTVDPVHQQAEVMLVTASWGLGSGVVEGRVPADIVQTSTSVFAI
jgi:pyruvate,water dikinase